MKKIVLILIVMSLAFAACKKDEHEDFYTILVTVVEKSNPHSSISYAEIWTGSELGYTNVEGQCTITLSYDDYGHYFSNSSEFDFYIYCYKSGYKEGSETVKIKKTKGNYTVTFYLEKELTNM